MPFALPEGQKFGCMCLVNAGVDRALRDGVFNLGNDISAVCGPPFEIEEHWREWLGSVKVGNLAQTSLALLSHSASNRPEILDGENETLVKNALSVFYGLLMAEVFHHDGGLILSGANVGAGVSVRQVIDLEPHVRPNGVHVRTISAVTLQRAANSATALRALHSSTRQYERFRNGFRAWLGGIREYYGGDRLHQFVRAVEAIVKPEIGRSEALFVHRCQVFAGTSDSTRELLRELYQLRSQAEHMNSFDSVLAKYDPAHRESIGLQRAYTSQLLASSVYERILTTPSLHACFDSDDHIDGFWRLPMHEQQATWGDSVNLETLARSGLEHPLA
jgi:hypothetical protein